MYTGRLFGLVAGLVVAGMAAPASSGVISDGTDDGYYTGLAETYESVGQISGSTTEYNFLASATYIGSNWLLTAAHVVDDATSLTFTLDGSTYEATNWFAHSKWNGDLGRGYDIGLIQLDRDVTGIEAATLYTGTGELGLIGTSVGYGTTGTGSTGWTTYDGLKRAGENYIDALLLTPGKDNRVLLSDFDNPDDASDSSWGSAVPLLHEYLIAPGDSGGGLFIVDETLNIVLAGVHSFGWGLIDGDPNSDYGDASGHTRVSSFYDWIMSFLDPTTVDDEGGGGGGGGPPPGKGKPFAMTGVVLVPEPGTMSLLGAGLVALGALARRRRSA